MSTRKVIVLAGVLALLVIGTTGCEECCRDRYDLISADDCPEQPPWQPPGPPIVSRPEPGTGGTIVWTAGGDPDDTLTSSGSIFDDDCELRGDFVGVGLIYLRFYEHEDDTTYSTPTRVKLENDERTIEIRRTAFNQIRWEVRTKGTDPQFCDVDPASSWDEDKIPSEFLDFDLSQPGTLVNLDNNKEGEKLEIQVKMPGT